MLHIFSIVLDGRPFVEFHLPVFERLTVPWRWYVVEGAAMNTADTAWCEPQQPRLSIDGTHEFLMSIAGPRVHVISAESWPNKTAMCNAALAVMDEPGILLQCDVDEIWSTEALERIVRLFDQRRDVGSMCFDCDYFVGPNLLATGENCWGHKQGEWLRAWRLTSTEMRFETHEPPVLSGVAGHQMTRQETSAAGYRFRHMAWVTEKQVAYKASFYGEQYRDAVSQWKALQLNQDWPCHLNRFLPWTDDRVIVQKQGARVERPH